MTDKEHILKELAGIRYHSRRLTKRVVDEGSGLDPAHTEKELRKINIRSHALIKKVEDMVRLCPQGSAPVKLDWINLESPPVLENPKCYKLSELTPANYPAFGIVCAGKVYGISEPDNTQDLYIDLEGQMWPYPLVVLGGRNAIITNGGFDLEVQTGCDVGELPNLPIANHPNSNIHPRCPAGGILFMSQWNVSWVEGLHFKANGIECDCIVSRNGAAGNSPVQTPQQALQTREFYVINTRAEGWENQGATASPNIGDGIHGDLFQNQGTIDPLKNLVFENVTALTSGEGIVNTSFPPSDQVKLRNFYYDFDPVYIADDYLDGIQQGVMLASNSLNVPIVENVHYRNGAGGPLAIQDTSGVNPAGTYYVDPADANGNNLLALNGLERIAGSSVNGEPSPFAVCDYAPEILTGVNYKTPFNYQYC